MERSRGIPTPECLDCGRRRRLRSVAGVDLGWQIVKQAPDPEPARHLRELLADARRDGETFEQAFESAVDYVLSCLDGPREDRHQWRVAFYSQRRVWQAGYERQTIGRTRLTGDLIDLVDLDDAEAA